jgi:hypothetical protein
MFLSAFLGFAQRSGLWSKLIDPNCLLARRSWAIVAWEVKAAVKARELPTALPSRSETENLPYDKDLT